MPSIPTPSPAASGSQNQSQNMAAIGVGVVVGVIILLVVVLYWVAGRKDDKTNAETSADTKLPYQEESPQENEFVTVPLNEDPNRLSDNQERPNAEGCHPRQSIDRGSATHSDIRASHPSEFGVKSTQASLYPQKSMNPLSENSLAVPRKTAKSGINRFQEGLAEGELRESVECVDHNTIRVLQNRGMIYSGDEKVTGS